jgi:hypothetical protein
MPHSLLFALCLGLFTFGSHILFSTSSNHFSLDIPTFLLPFGLLLNIAVGKIKLSVTCMFCCDRDYRAEWERIKKEKQVEEMRQKEQKMQQVIEGEGKPVSLVTEVPMGQELADIYLKHPANEGSEDEEGEENVPHLTEGGRMLHGLMQDTKT